MHKAGSQAYYFGPYCLELLGAIAYLRYASNFLSTKSTRYFDCLGRAQPFYRE